MRTVGGTAATAGGPTCVWSKYHVIRGEPSCAQRHQDGEFLGTGKRRVEGRKVKGGTKRATGIRKADARLPRAETARDRCALNSQSRQRA